MECQCKQEDHLCDVCCKNGENGECKPTSEIASMRDLNLQQYPGAPCDDFSGYCDRLLKCRDYTTDLISKLKAASTIHREECENGGFTL